MKLSRRDFVRYSLGSLGAVGSASILGHLGAATAAASVGSDYKALVCIFLLGGNDCHNTVIPKQTGSDPYSAARQGTDLFVDFSSSGISSTYGKLPIGGTQPPFDFAIAPNFSNLRSLYNSGQAAIVANVGPINVSTVNSTFDPKTLSKSNFSSYLPDSAFSHSDQQNQWQAAAARNADIGSGWGGRVADHASGVSGYSNVNAFPVSFNSGSSGLYTVGASSSPTFAWNKGVHGIQTDSNGQPIINRDVIEFANGTKLMQASDTLLANGDTQAKALQNALSNNNLTNDFSAQFAPAKGSIAGQLQLVAQVISESQSLKINRQVFFVALGGFDTHTGELASLLAAGGLQQQLDSSIAAFMSALNAIAVSNGSNFSPSQVTLFTSSEFGRSLQPSAGGGCDHGWGGHHFVIGGAVKGGKIYGAYPDLTINGQQDATGRGVLIPTTSVEQYCAPLANWFGVASTDLTGSSSTVFPNLNKFATGSSQNLGFI